MKRIVLCKFVFVLSLCLICCGCWSLKSVEGKDALNLGELLYNRDQFISLIELPDHNGEQKKELPKDVMQFSSLSEYVNYRLHNQLIIGQTTYPQSVLALGEPQETRYEGRLIIALWKYEEEYNKGHYRWNLRKVQSKASLGYYVTAVFCPPEDITPDKLTTATLTANSKADKAKDEPDEWEELKPGGGAMGKMPKDSDVNYDAAGQPDYLLKTKSSLPPLKGVKLADYKTFVLKNFRSEVTWPNPERVDKLDPLQVGRSVGSGATKASSAVIP